MVVNISYNSPKSDHYVKLAMSTCQTCIIMQNKVELDYVWSFLAIINKSARDP